MFTLRLLGSASLEGPDGPVTGRAALRQRVALLALLAVEHPRPLSRDKLVATLWPESDTGDARHLLRESLYILRSALGEHAVLGTGDDLRLNPDRLTCDLWEFEAALARSDPEAAVGMYHGPFLSGFHLTESEGFEPWAEGERLRLARRYVQALEELAKREMHGGDRLRAVEWWARLASEDPYNSRIALEYMQALEAAGDRAGALRHAGVHSELLRADLDAVPEGEVVALAERLRLESRAAPAWEPARPSLDTPPATRTGPAARRSWVAPVVLVVAVVIGLGVVGGALSRARSPALSSRRIAAAPFENRTGRRDLDDLGPMAADWIVRGVLETPLFGRTEPDAVYTRDDENDGRPLDPTDLARREGAGMVIRGSYYLSGDSVLFQAGVMEVPNGRVLKSFDPVGARLERAVDALEALRERVAVGLSPLVDSGENWNGPVDPDLVPPPNLAAYREFVAGIGEVDGEAAAEHYRRAARLDSSFAAPLIQLAFDAAHNDECSITDSIAVVLESRRAGLTAWTRITIDKLRAGCRGDIGEMVRLLEQRYRAYPQSVLAGGVYATVGLLPSDQPRAAREVLQHGRELLRRSDPQRAREWRYWYWWKMAATWHMPGGYAVELDITNRWRDSTTWEWQVVRGRALAALGRDREVMALLASQAGVPADSVADRHLTTATELAAHGHARTARAVAQRLLERLELEPSAGWGRASNIARANRLLGRTEDERDALEQIAGSDADTLAKLEAVARIAVLLSDTARAQRVDRILAEQSDRPSRSPWARAAEILARAHIAAGFGRREQAVALLRDASTRGLFSLGSSYEYHTDLLLAPLRGYPPFDALLQPDN